MMVVKRIPTENPICSPNKSLAHPMSHGPSIPPSPANVKSIPRMVFVFFGWSTDTAAVKVGREKNAGAGECAYGNTQE